MYAAATDRRRPGRHKPVSGKLSVGVALLCLGAQLSSTLHGLVVAHEVCPEHGEILHAGRDAHPEAHAGTGASFRHPVGHAVHPGAAEDSSADVTARQAALRAAGDLGAHAHDHCTDMCERRQLLHLRSPASAWPLWLGVRLAVPQTLPARGPSHATFALAPKTSPPA